VPIFGDEDDAAGDGGGDRPKEVLGTSVPGFMRENARTMQLVCADSVFPLYAEISAVAECTTRAGSAKATVTEACSKAFEHSLTVCHVGREENDGEEEWSGRAAKAVRKLWKHTSQNGMFVCVAGGTKTQSAVVGVALNMPG
jgi:hypothetical protein